MTQEQKAKAYDEAFNRAKSWYTDAQIDFKKSLETLFPELKCDDEKIRKEIIKCVKNYGPSSANPQLFKNMLAWLEKQGQKPSDRVEPKFHEGDWITNGDYTWKIVEVKPLDYILQSQDGNIVDDTISHLDEQFHSFTIQDAKDGDVLACPLPKGYEDREQIFIFKGINSRDYVENCIEYYCRICDGVFYVNENGYMGTTSSPLYPATKSQRDTLFAKMKEAGFEWDSEKKELKKISQHMISAEAKEAMYDKPTDNDMVEALRTEYEKGRADVLRCIDPDVMVADFCSQPLSKTRSLASIYRQGIFDIIKRIDNNEETSITSTRSINDGGVHRA